MAVPETYRTTAPGCHDTASLTLAALHCTLHASRDLAVLNATNLLEKRNALDSTLNMT